MSNVDDVLISIRPNYAEAILSGEKTVELRRRIPAINPGTHLWIYATRPLGAIVGSATVDDIIEGTPAQIWEDYMDRIGVGQCAYKKYFAGTDQALGLLLSDITRLRRIGIEQLREMREGFHPPQVLARLSPQETSSLRKLAFALS